MASNIPNRKLVKTNLKQYQSNVKVIKQQKPKAQKVFRDEHYKSVHNSHINSKRNQTVPRFNQDEYTTEEESFVPNTRILKNDVDGNLK